MTDQTHYVCPECEGVSGQSGVCTTEDCDREDDELLECNCDDGSHMELMDDNMDDMEEDYDEDMDDDMDEDYDDDFDDEDEDY